MKKILVSLLLVFPLLCLSQSNTSKTDIDLILNQWHKAASEASFETYFGLMTNDAVFIGTDATENWKLDEFKTFAKPYFDKGKAWSFTMLERNIFTQKENSLAWFDELLDTQMGICRGSGIMEKTKDGWKVKHYVLSIAIPNEDVQAITKMKYIFDTDLINKIRSKKN